MSEKMPRLLHNEIISNAIKNNWSIDESSPSVDQYSKLITLNSALCSRRLFVDKNTGFSKNGDLLYFKVAVHPAKYDVNAESLPGITASINRRTGNNLHSHSGYQGCPVIDPHKEPCAKAYRVEDLPALKRLLALLVRE